MKRLTKPKKVGMNKITYDERVKIYNSAIETWGQEAQTWVAVEEMSELTKELCKLQRGGSSPLEVADEIADVTIMLEQLRIMYDLNEFVCERMDYKLARLEKRLNNNQTNETEGT